MKCRNCKRELPENSLYCNWCGVKQIKEKTDISIPKPQKTKTGYHGQIMVSGKRIRVSGKTEKEYRENAKALKSGEKDVNNQTLKECIEDYINSNSDTLSPGTIRGYDQILRNRFRDYMNQKAADIDYQKMVNEEAKKIVRGRKISPKTIANGWGLVSAALKYAKIKKPDINTPDVPTPETDFLDHEQIKTFLKGIKGDKCELAALLALHSLRASEMFHLTAEDVSDGQIRVAGAMVRDKNNHWVDKQTNKNRKSTRTIPVIIPRVMELLPESGRLVLPKQQTIRTHLERVCIKNNLPIVTLHDLRRSFASLAAYLHWQEETICAVGGWKPGSPIVHDIYIKISNKAISEDVQKMKKYLE